MENLDDTKLALRQLAEIKAQAQPAYAYAQDNPKFNSPEALCHMLHELQVHQIELELQNEELRSAQLELDAARARYFDLYDLAPVGYCTLDVTGLILEANFTAATLLGLTRKELTCETLARFILKPDQDIYYLCRQQLINTSAAQSCELRMVKRNGEQFWAQLTVTNTQNKYGAPVFRVILSDVSERKALDQALADKNIELSRARAIADKANQAKAEFLSSMTHELRSPLNAILGFAQLMATSTPEPTPLQSSRIEQIVQSGWYLLGLIDDILAQPLVEPGQSVPNLNKNSL